jgi:glucan phosphoethanolaminetransferase (alkaline phosphatase superfamily)
MMNFRNLLKLHLPSPFTNQTHKEIRWVSIYGLTVFSVLFYTIMEWLFFVTKASFMDRLTLWDRLAILITSFAALTALAVPFFLILAALGAILRSKQANIIIKQIGLLLPAAVLAVTALLLIDNFTYTVFKFGIVTSSGFGRALYGLLFVVLLVAIYIDALRRLPSAVGRRPFSKCSIAAGIILALAVILSALQAPGVSSSTTLVKDPTPQKLPNIILLGSDGMSAEHLSLYGYNRETTPYLEQLAKVSLVMRNHFTNSGNSSGSVISIFTDKLSTQTRVIYPPDILQASDAYQHLPGILKQLGYGTTEISTAHYLDAYTLNLKNGFDMVNQRTMVASSLTPIERFVLSDNAIYFLESLTERISDRLLHISFIRDMPNPYQDVLSPTADITDQDRLDQLEQIIKTAQQPYFVHVHMMGTHGSRFTPTNQAFSAGETQDSGWMADFYDDAILDFDGYVNQVVDLLKQTGQWDNTILIIYSDHAQLWSTLHRIPSLIHFPGDEHAGVIYAPTQNMDITPTILDEMNISIPDWMDGQSLLSNDLSVMRPIFSAGDRNNEMMGENMWFYNLDLAKAPFFQFGSFDEVVCQRWVQFDTTAKAWTNGEIPAYEKPCSADTLPTLAQMQSTLIEQLKSDGFDTQQMTDAQ